MIITDEEKTQISEELKNEFDFFRRLEGRLMVQKHRLKQVEEASFKDKVKQQRNKVQAYETKILEIRNCISEMEFIRNNVIDDFYERNQK